VTFDVDDAFCGFNVSFGMLRLDQTGGDTVLPPFDLINGQLQLRCGALMENSQDFIVGNDFVHDMSDSIISQADFDSQILSSIVPLDGWTDRTDELGKIPM